MLGMVFTLGAEEVTSENGPRLKEFYAKFPKSDLDKNGILTLDEMHDYLDKKIEDGSRSDDKGKNLISRIYLKKLLKRSPDTDLNKDGVLTKEELLTFVKQNKAVSPEGLEEKAEDDSQQSKQGKTTGQDEKVAATNTQ